jgi:hypothetical protein
MPREPKLEMLPDSDMKISGDKFRRIVRRIECTVPLDGFAIYTEPTDEGIKCHLDAERVTLNVCCNGVPSTITIYSYVESKQA